MAMTIFFRGRQTESIILDAARAGIDTKNPVVICRESDQLAQPTDVTDISDHPWSSGDVVIIANGGTTEQLVPLLARYIRAAVENDAEYACSTSSDSGAGPRDWTLRVYDVQRDRVTVLIDMPAHVAPET